MRYPDSDRHAPKQCYLGKQQACWPVRFHLSLLDAAHHRLADIQTYWLMKPYRPQRSGASGSPQQQRDPGSRVLDSTSAKGRIRGTARQLVERYLQFAEEARLAGDRVASEAFLQSAEHYTRLNNSNRHVEARPPKRQPYMLLPSESGPSESSSHAAPPMTARPCGQTSEPQAVTPVTELPHEETDSSERDITARRSAAAADLERVARQHGYTLADLGLALLPS